MTAIKPAFERIGEENAFAVLARAPNCSARGATSSISASASRTSRRRRISSRRPSRLCATASMAIPTRLASRRCARRWRRTCTTARGRVSPARVMIVPGGKVTMFIAIVMFGEKGVDIVSPEPGLSDLSLDDRVHRRAPNPDPDAGGERLRLLGRGDAGADDAEDPPLILNSPANPTGGVTPKRRDRQARRRARDATRTRRSCRTRSTAR